MDTNAQQPGAMGNVQELYPGHAADLAKRERRVGATAAANVDPLPGPLAEIFGHVPSTIAGLTVRALVHYDFVLLRKLESPMLEQMKAAMKAVDGNPPAVPFTDEQGYEIIYQFTRPVKEVAALLARGREAFTMSAIDEIGAKLSPVEVGQLMLAVQREFVRAFSAVIKYVAPQAETEPGTVFTRPPAEAQTTASVGGSNTSAA